MTDFIAWHGRNLLDHSELRDKWAAQGYRFISVSIYGPVSAPIFAAVMIKGPIVAPQRDWPLLTASEWQQTFNEQAAQGFGPVILAATGSAADPRFSAVFEPKNPIPLTRHGLTSGDILDPNTIEGMHNVARGQGLILHWCASYGSAGDPRFAAIWIPNVGADLWNNEGLLDDPTNYQARFDAETAAWCRPGFVTLNGDNRYMSLFLADQVGPWVARHNLTPEDYQNEFNKWTAQGFFPSSVQAAGASASTARFAALFVKSKHTLARSFSASGPVGSAAIDAVVEQTMRQYPITRHASLAIVNGKKLVYARAYTLAEPDWPTVEPKTRFRLASVSKTITALAVFQLIESGKLALSDRLQDILKLRTPAGSLPVDPKFAEITTQNLLEHKGGLDPNAFANGPAVVQAFISAGHPASLPVTQDMTDAYIASLNLVSSPGGVQAYSNCGYYLLGRVVARLRGVNSSVDAYQSHLFNPLGIRRIRGAVDLLSAQPADEARYQSGMTVDTSRTPTVYWPDLRVFPSVQSPAQPLVPSGYGDYELEITPGAGGMSAATTDLAQLIAILIDQNDSPALKRATITSMLSKAAALAAARPAPPAGNDWRAGYGLDWAVNQQGGSFYGQKGGLINDAASVFEFNGQWGFALCWGCTGYAGTSYPGPVYPDFHAVMDIAKAINWGSTDLFPHFGMPSL